jgi:transposase
MMAALVAGAHDPQALADLARTRMRTKISHPEETFAGLGLGTFDDHHRFQLARMLARVDAVDADIAAVDAQIGQHLDLSMMRSPVSMRSRHSSHPSLQRP